MATSTSEQQVRMILWYMTKQLPLGEKIALPLTHTDSLCQCENPSAKSQGGGFQDPVPKSIWTASVNLNNNWRRAKYQALMPCCRKSRGRGQVHVFGQRFSQVAEFCSPKNGPDPILCSSPGPAAGARGCQASGLRTGAEIVPDLTVPIGNSPCLAHNSHDLVP